MADSAASTLVVSKLDNTRYTTVITEGPSVSLGPSSVRVHTKLISVTSNNLSYARMGAVLHWWDAFQVPETAPFEFHDREKWGIVPAWGYGEVVASTIERLKVGTVLWGFWPMSSYPVDLQFRRIDPSGYWQETSGQRSKMMDVYNQYIETDTSGLEDATKGWVASLQPVFATGYQLNRFVFPSSTGSSVVEPQHPFGSGDGWNAPEADLTASVLVSLGAATKTGRGFAWQIFRNRATSESGPLGFLQVTSNPSSLWNPNLEQSRLQVKVTTYSALSEADTIAWIAKLNPARLVVVDFGGTSNVLESFKSSIDTSKLFKSTPSVNLVGVGTEMRVLSREEMTAKMALGQKLGRVQFNSGGLRARGIELEGATAYFSGLNASFDRFLKEKGIGDLSLKWGHGITGENGVEGTWAAMCNGTLSPLETRVFKI